MEQVNLVIVFTKIIIIFFLPGFGLTWYFYSSGEIDWIERIYLSCAISIVLVPLAFFGLFKFGGEVVEKNILLITTGLLLFEGIGLIWIKRTSIYSFVRQRKVKIKKI